MTVLDTLGAGGFGVVLAAYDPDLDRKVALKVLRTSVFGSAHAEQTRVRLLREARAMARLSHPNVVTVHDVGTIHGHVYIAMELVAGGTVTDWIEREQPRWREIVDVFVAAGRGLEAAHEAGLVHRDVKPDNILVGTDGRVRVTDFGIVSASGCETATEAVAPGGASEDLPEAGGARVEASLTRTGVLVGTPAYMSPEQHRCTAVDARADQYSFCVSLYEALYGTRPFAGDSREELAESACRGDVPKPPQDSEVPARVAAIVLRGLSVRPEDRYPSMGALLAELSSDPTASRRRRNAAAALALAVLLAFVGTIFAVTRSGRRGDACDNSVARLASVWNEEVRGRVEQAFLSVGGEHAIEVQARVENLLDAYAERLGGLQRELCEATRGAAGDPEPYAHLRMFCLANRLDRLAALADLLATQMTPTVAALSVELAQDLPQLDSCMASDSVPVGIPPPKDPGLAQKVSDLRLRIAKSRVHIMAGNYDQAVAEAAKLLEEARALKYPPVVVEAQTLLGRAQMWSDHRKDAAVTLRAAAEAAEEIRHDEVAAEAWTELVWVLKQLGDRERALSLRARAEAAVRHAGNQPLVRAELLDVLGGTIGELGDTRGAWKCFEEALALIEAAAGPEHPMASCPKEGMAGALMAQGRFDAALELFEEALVITRNGLGADHPRVARVLAGIGTAKLYLGGRDEAREAFEQSLDIYTRAYGPDSSYLRWPLLGLAWVEKGRGRYDEAREYLQRLLRIEESNLGPEHRKLVEVLRNLGQNERAAGDKRAALGYFRRAAKIAERQPGKESLERANDLTEVGRELAELGELEEGLEVWRSGRSVLRSRTEDHPGEMRRDNPFEEKVAELASERARRGDREGALKVCNENVPLFGVPGKGHAGASYNAASCYALAGDHDRAFDYLEKSVVAGFSEVDHAESSSEFGTLRRDRRWKPLMARMRANRRRGAGTRPTGREVLDETPTEENAP